MLSWGQPADVLEHLHGAWHFDRTIDDKANMAGEASFALHSEGFVLYRESGLLRLASGEEFNSHRSYLFREAPCGFAVFFAESPPRLFHQITLRDSKQGELAGDATHSCGEDLYVSTYQFMPGFVFSVHHRVHGPKKNYLSHTVFRRAVNASLA
jgi:hypothetical protein